ncbi:hypothetical protein C7G83_15180 [Siccibacter turicensis]|uniref:Uncharacterized protein n=1 Tax=Siccibacter turicensis TaxID=357233 RepID=A0A2P8VHB4_9ENTR|nr:hypothetical protein C7G83_15180 [Siccibacter turicensis]
MLINALHPPGRSIRPHLTKLLTILKQQTANESCLAADNLAVHPHIIRKKPAVGPAFSLTSPDGECQTACC